MVVTPADFQAFDAVGALVVVLDVDGRIAHWNQPCSEVTGYSLEEVRGLRLWDFLLDAEAIESQPMGLATPPTDQPPSRFAGYWVTKSGERRWITWSSTVTPGSDGRPGYSVATGITAMASDATEQRRWDRERGLLAELGAALADTIDYGDTLTRVAGLIVRDLADFCIVDVLDRDGTPRRAKVLHRDPGQTALCEMFQRLPVDPEHARLVSSVVTSRQARLMPEVSPQYVAAAVRDDAHRRALQELDARSVIVAPLSVRGNVLGALVLVSCHPTRRYGEEDLHLAEEIANRAAVAIENARLHAEADAAAHDLREANQQMVMATIQAQEQREEAETARALLAESDRELREIAASRETFIGVLGHDLRNPIAAINMTVAAMLADAHLDKNTKANVTRIMSCSRRMGRMISRLLDLTRARLGGGFALEPRPIDLGELCQTVVGEFEALVHLEVEGDMKGVWDPDLLAEALSNIVGNAVEHATPGTAVVVKARADGAHVVVEIANEGEPIPAEVLPFIFEPFRGARQQRSASGNLGLGLYIASEIVQAGSGTLAARSAGGTTTFLMRLPRQAPPAANRNRQTERRA